MKKTKINDFVVKKVAVPVDKRPVKGADLFAKAYCTVMLLGKKESSKTIVVDNIIENRVESNTTVVIYSATLYYDSVWIAIRDKLRKQGIPTILHTSISDEEGVNTLREFLGQLNDEAKQRDKERLEALNKKKKKFLKKVVDPVKWDEEDEEEEKEKKPKFLAADWPIIFDDMSSEIKDKSLEELIKLHRPDIITA